MDLGPSLIALVVVGTWLFIERSNSQFNYFFLVFYVFSNRLSLEIVLLTLYIIVVIYWSFKSRHLLLSILYVGALRFICWPWLFWGMLLFIDRSENRVSYFINFFFVDLECCGGLLMFRFSLQILYQLLLCITYTLLDHVARFVNLVCLGSFWTFRLSIQLLYSLLLCILSTLKLGGRFVGLGCCGSLLIRKLFEFDRSDSRSSYFISSFYVFSVRWGL